MAPNRGVPPFGFGVRGNPVGLREKMILEGDSSSRNGMTSFPHIDTGGDRGHPPDRGWAYERPRIKEGDL